MMIIRVMGGLGNQMQQYALYKKMESLGKDARLDTSWFRDTSRRADGVTERGLELDYLEGVCYKEASEDDIRSVLGRLWEEPENILSKVKRKFIPSGNPVFEEKEMYHEQIFSFTDKYLVGYWACEKYYADILNSLRSEIRFPENTDQILRQENDRLIQQMQEAVSVSVHIRRGDYLEGVNRALFGNICKETYYESAIAYMKERFDNVKFFLFSDDIPYLEEHYRGEGFQIVDCNKGQNSFYDIQLMSRCRHNICANSTFSFWGARLNPNEDKIMIRPSIHKNTQVCIPTQMKDLWKGWTLITPQGEILS